MPSTALKLPEHTSITPADANIASPEQPTAKHHSLNTLQSAMLQQIGGAVVELGLYD